jgi:uncharacterized protein with ParB-like and HNH nuclease domain
MKVESLKIAKVFSGGGEVHYILPHFQREYAWDRSNWETLLDDVFSIYKIYDPPRNEPEHFMGALVVISDGNRSGTIPAFKLVDGQQRLVTISLALCALGNVIEKTHSSVHRKIRKLLENEDEVGLLRYKLVPTEKYDDRRTYTAIIDGKLSTSDFESRSRIISAYDYLFKQLRNRINSGIDAERLFLVFANCLQVVFIDLDQRERPYEIFESLNAKGRALTQPDLIRNYIAMMLPEEYQQEAFDAWARIEDLLRESRTVSRIGELTAFLRHYLGFRNGALPNKEHVYARFRDQMKGKFDNPSSFVQEIYVLQGGAEIYDRFLRPEHEADVGIKQALERLGLLESTTAYPFLLFLFEQYHLGSIRRMDLIEGLQTIENYLMRRYLAGESTQYTSRMFPTLERDIVLDNIGHSLREALLRRNYPTDLRIREVLPTLLMYEKRDNSLLEFLLSEINQYLSRGSGGYTILDGAATIEHIMPQDPSPIWKSHLGDSWKETYRDYLHTLGNLTIVTQEWNSKLSNAPFAEKRELFARHALKLNSSYFSELIPSWDAQAIRERAAKLTDIALAIWAAFGEPPAVVRPRKQKPATLIVRGEQYETANWRDVSFQMIEAAINLEPNFESFVEDLSSRYLTREPRERAKELSNGWWLYMSLSSDDVMALCERVAKTVGLEDDEWQITFDDE